MRVFLFPYGGLANRMRAISSAVSKYSHSKKKLTIIWVKEGGMNCAYCEVFRPNKGIIDKSYSTIQRKIHRYVRKWHLTEIALKALRKLHILSIVDIYDGDTAYDAEPILNGKYLCTIIKACYNFFCDDFNKTLFRLNPSIHNKELAKITQNTVGVHIRRTDNVFSTEHSPLELFEKRMQEELKNCPSTKFFLCSDDITVKKYFQSPSWVDYIDIPTGNIDRESPAGIIQAACEMQALSKCRMIIGSYFSSFGEVAAQMGDIPLEILSDKTKTESSK